MKGNAILSKVTENSKKLLNEAKGLKAEAYCTMAAVACGAYFPVAEAADAKGIIKSICDIIATKIFPLVGGVIALIGVFKLIMAIRNDQPEAQASSARDIVIGAVMVAFGVIFWNPISSALF